MVYMLLSAGANYKQESSDGVTLFSRLSEVAELHSGTIPGRIKKSLFSLAEEEAKSEGRDPEPDDWKSFPLDKRYPPNVVYFLKVIDWLSEHEPSWREELAKMKSEVKAAYQEELDIDVEHVDYDPFAEEWGNKR